MSTQYNLPPQPKPHVSAGEFYPDTPDFFTCEQLRAYAIAAIEQDRAARGPDDDDLLTIAYMHGFAKGKDAAAPQQVPLKQPEKQRLWNDATYNNRSSTTDAAMDFGSAIEAAHGIGTAAPAKTQGGE